MVADLAAGNLVFSPDANEFGSAYASFTFAVRDDGGIANGGINLDQSPNALTFNVLPINDAPDGADTAIAIGEDAPYTFAQATSGSPIPPTCRPPTRSRR